MYSSSSAATSLVAGDVLRVTKPAELRDSTVTYTISPSKGIVGQSERHVCRQANVLELQDVSCIWLSADGYSESTDLRFVVVKTVPVSPQCFVEEMAAGM